MGVGDSIASMETCGVVLLAVAFAAREHAAVVQPANFRLRSLYSVVQVPDVMRVTHREALRREHGKRDVAHGIQDFPEPDSSDGLRFPRPSRVIDLVCKAVPELDEPRLQPLMGERALQLLLRDPVAQRYLLDSMHYLRARIGDMHSIV